MIDTDKISQFFKMLLIKFLLYKRQKIIYKSLFQLKKHKKSINYQPIFYKIY